MHMQYAVIVTGRNINYFSREWQPELVRPTELPISHPLASVVDVASLLKLTETSIYVTVNLRNQWLREIPSNYGYLL